MVFLKAFRRRFFQIAGSFLIMLLLMAPFAWMSVSHPQHVQNIGTIIAQNAYLFSIFRWVLILSFFLFWRSLISRIGLRQDWPWGKIQFWQKQRIKIMVWLVLFELVLCENLLLTVFHLLESA